jgi:hypothetical protein
MRTWACCGSCQAVARPTLCMHCLVSMAARALKGAWGTLPAHMLVPGAAYTFATAVTALLAWPCNVGSASCWL